MTSSVTYNSVPVTAHALPVPVRSESLFPAACVGELLSLADWGRTGARAYILADARGCEQTRNPDLLYDQSEVSGEIQFEVHLRY